LPVTSGQVRTATARNLQTENAMPTPQICRCWLRTFRAFPEEKNHRRIFWPLFFVSYWLSADVPPERKKHSQNRFHFKPVFFKKSMFKEKVLNRSVPFWDTFSPKTGKMTKIII